MCGIRREADSISEPRERDSEKELCYSRMTMCISKSEHSEEYYQKLDTVRETDYTKTF